MYQRQSGLLRVKRTNEADLMSGDTAMNGFQFLHLESYARQVTQRGALAKTQSKAGGHTIDSVIAEAERLAGNCPHVSNPKPPILLHGAMPSEAAKRAKAWAKQAVDARGHKLRKDGLCMVAGVVSCPASMQTDWPRFKAATLAYLQLAGDRLVSVVEHTDEGHPHLHFFMVALNGESFEDIHPGKSAAAKAARDGQTKGAQNQAYIQAMRALQDDFHQEVASKYGMARLGPKRRRLTRNEWRAEQAANKSSAQSIRQQMDDLSKAKNKLAAVTQLLGVVARVIALNCHEQA